MIALIGRALAVFTVAIMALSSTKYSFAGDAEHQPYYLTVEDTIALANLVFSPKDAPAPSLPGSGHILGGNLSKLESYFYEHANPDAALPILRSIPKDNGYVLGELPRSTKIEIVSMLIKPEDKNSLISIIKQPLSEVSSALEASRIYTVYIDRGLVVSEQDKRKLLKMGNVDLQMRTRLCSTMLSVFVYSNNYEKIRNDFEEINNDSVGEVYADEKSMKIIERGLIKDDYTGKAYKNSIVGTNKLHRDNARPIGNLPEDIAEIVKRYDKTAHPKEDIKSEAHPNESTEDNKQYDTNAAFISLAHPVVRDVVTGLFADGSKEFDKFIDLLKERDYRLLAPQLMDNGKPLMGKKLELAEQLDESYVKAVDNLRDLMINVISGNKIAYTDFHVKMQYEAIAASFNEKPPNAEVNGTTPKSDEGSSIQYWEVVTLCFTISGTSAKFKEYAPHIAGESALKTIAKNGDLRVFLKRINGKWYWNPFGW